MDTHAFIHAQNLCKTFQMGRQTVVALAGLDLQVAAGTFTVIMGPSGSGKSTLLYQMGGLDRPTSGSLRVGGLTIDRLDENDLAVYRRHKVGFIFQSFNLISSLNALENVAFPMRFSGISSAQRRLRAVELLKQVGLEKRMYHKPTELSGGQQQRVAIARALVNNPPLILADEPTGNLDTSSGMSIMHVLAELHRGGRTIVVVTHDPRMLRFANHVVYLLDGKAVSESEYQRASELVNSSGLEEYTSS